jgi:hypothetical protein
MPFTMKYIEDEGYLLLEHHGDVSPEEVREARTALLARDNPGRVLIDWRDASGVPPAADFYFIINETRVARPTRNKCALLTPEASKSMAEFVENACRNRGFPIQAFTDRAAALRWLMDDER